jgi:hypothetical protein
MSLRSAFTGQRALPPAAVEDLLSGDVQLMLVRVPQQVCMCADEIRYAQTSHVACGAQLDGNRLNGKSVVLGGGSNPLKIDGVPYRFVASDAQLPGVHRPSAPFSSLRVLLPDGAHEGLSLSSSLTFTSLHASHSVHSLSRERSSSERVCSCKRGCRSRIQQGISVA